MSWLRDFRLRRLRALAEKLSRQINRYAQYQRDAAMRAYQLDPLSSPREWAYHQGHANMWGSAVRRAQIDLKHTRDRIRELEARP